MIIPANNKSIQEIPITQESGKQYLPWIIGLLVLLLLLVLACATSIGGTLLRWHGGVDNNKMTIEIPIVEGGVASVSPTVQQVMGILQTIPGIVRSEIVDEDRLLSLLKPWVGQIDLLRDLQLPALIDIDLDPSVPLDIGAITQQLREVSAGIRIEPHARWHHMLVSLGQAIKSLSYVIIGLIICSIFVVISLITKSSLSTYREIIDILRLMGAKNTYVARQFQIQAFKTCFQGGIIGVVFALPIIYFLSWFAQYLGIPEIFKNMITPGIMVTFVCLPFIISILSMIVSRLTVLRMLARMDR
jgi:cell division transport system permease protein